MPMQILDPCVMAHLTDERLHAIETYSVTTVHPATYAKSYKLAPIGYQYPLPPEKPQKYRVVNVKLLREIMHKDDIC